jgi:hypothetical protein
MNKLTEIQQALNVPKSLHNEFGNFNYRSCEKILEAVKPLLGDFYLALTDEIVNIGNRYYVKATAVLKNDKEEYSTTAYAREPEIKKGMDESQITGAASSYARKYALNGLFAIDDTKDADSMDNRQAEDAKEPKAVMDDLTSECTLHNVQMIQGISKKTGSPYHYHRDQNGMCFGKGYIREQK